MSCANWVREWMSSPATHCARGSSACRGGAILRKISAGGAIRVNAGQEISPEEDSAAKEVGIAFSPCTWNSAGWDALAQPQPAERSDTGVRSQSRNEQRDAVARGNCAVAGRRVACARHSPTAACRWRRLWRHRLLRGVLVFRGRRFRQSIVVAAQQSRHVCAPRYTVLLAGSASEVA